MIWNIWKNFGRLSALINPLYSKATGLSCGDEDTWLDLDHGLVCGDCKVLVANMTTKYSTCSSYCRAIGRTCTGAWEEEDEDCRVKSTEDCQHDFGNYTSDAICECGAGDQKEGCKALKIQ